MSDTTEQLNELLAQVNPETAAERTAEAGDDMRALIETMALMAQAMKRIVEALPALRDIAQVAEDNAIEKDYCFCCDEHPSYGHGPDCPLVALREVLEPQT
jgi:hypothetical protein